MSPFFLHISMTVSRWTRRVRLPMTARRRTIALNGARELLCEQIKRGYLNLDNYIVVADQTGHELSRVHFGEALVVRPLLTPGLRATLEIYH